VILAVLVGCLVYGANKFVIAGPNFCPSNISHDNLSKIKSVEDCSELREVDTDLYHDCNKFKRCTPCPEHGYCATNGTLVEC
jgi:hypothetical protein